MSIRYKQSYQFQNETNNKQDYYLLIWGQVYRLRLKEILKYTLKTKYFT